MASPTPWIANLIVESLHVYLSSGFAQTQPERLPFKYLRNNSNLFISATGSQKTLLYLSSWDISRSGKSVKAHASDGEIGIDITFLRQTQPSEESPDAGHAPLATGSILKLHDFEIRLADCIEPPKLTLHLKQFDIIPQSATTEFPTLSTIYQHDLANQYIRKWKRLDRGWTMDLDPSSPAEIRSQVGLPEDSDEENRDPYSSSQVGFATQLPLQKPAKIAVRDTVPLTPPKKRVQDREECHVKDHNIDDISVTPTSASQPVTQLQRSKNVKSTAGDLTQRQLLAPPSSVSTGNSHQNDKQKASSNEPFPGTGEATRPNNSQAVPESMPEAVFQLLRHWRKECHDGRYIPRRLQIVPKDQATLLDSDDRWQPPLAGHAHRQGTVPLDLLNRITHNADASHIPASHTEHTVELATEKTYENNGRDLQDREVSPISSETDSEESEPISWSSSPPRPPVLPPNSSPLLPTTIGITTNNPNPEEPFEEMCPTASKPEMSAKAQRPFTEHPSECALNNTEQLDNTEYERVVPQANSDAQREALILPSTADLNLKPTSKSVQRAQKTVQVKRTPYPTKDILPDDEVPDSSTNVIPGTFDERQAVRKLHPLATGVDKTRVLDKGIEKQQADIFEIDSSENETRVSANFRSHIKPKLVSSHLQARPIDTNTSPSNSKSDTLTGPLDTSSSKRKIDAADIPPPKRIKDRKSDLYGAATPDSDYSFIDSARLRDRRSFRSKLGAKQKGEDDSQHVSAVSDHCTKQNSRSIPNLADDSLSSSPNVRQVDRLETSDTHMSIHRSMRPGAERGTVISSTSIVSQPKKDPSSEIFALFTAAYPDYRGNHKHFDAACQLLKTLQLQGRATHPSLWDDFLFRHFHDYRYHLQEVMETCGNALPYETFYEQCVEQPTHLQRIVKPHHINGVSFHQASVRSSMPPITHIAQNQLSTGSTSTKFITLDRSVAAESSISNIDANDELREAGLRSALEHSDASGIAKTQDHIPRESALLEQEDSQSSRTSVKLWLERASGAESPLLGTPEIRAKKDSDVPTIELSQDDVGTLHPLPIANIEKKKRKLPWASSLVQETPSPPSLNNADNSGRPRISLTSPNASGSQSQAIAKLTDKSKEAARVATTQKSWKDASKKLSSPISTSTYRSSQAHPSRPETAFTRFTHLYNNLPGETQALGKLDGRAARMIDIFAWRR